MRSTQPARRAVALSSFDLPEAQALALHGCEDCACAVSVDRPAVEPTGLGLPLGTNVSAGQWVRGPEVLEIPIDPEHHVLFNPLGRGGVMVVNEPARRIFRSFEQPRSVDDARLGGGERHGGFDETVRRLRDLEMIQPIEHLARRPDIRSGTTLTAWLHVTNACNLRCPYCYISKTDEGMDESVGTAAVDAVMRSALRHGFHAVKLKYAGGEASLNHRLMLALNEHARTLADEHGLRLHSVLLSNGVALRGELVEALKHQNIRVMISLDGVGEDHDWQRPFANGKPSFRFVDRTIARLIEQEHAPHLSITITNRNAAGLAEAVRYALERDLTFSLNLFRDNDCAASFPDLRYEEQAMIKALNDAFAVIEEHLPPWSVLGSVLDRGQLVEPRLRSCGVGQDYVVIDHRGQVSKCHMEIERTLGDVFSSDPLQLIREDETTARNLSVEEKEGCRDCAWRYWCSGGCTVATFRATGRYDIKSPNCNIYKAIYPKALRLEGLRLLKYAATEPASGSSSVR